MQNQEQGNQRKFLQGMNERPESKIQSRSPSSGVDNQSMRSIQLGDKYLTNQTVEDESDGSDQILFSDHCYEKIDVKMQNLKVQPKKNWESRNGQILKREDLVETYEKS